MEIKKRDLIVTLITLFIALYFLIYSSSIFSLEWAYLLFAIIIILGILYYTKNINKRVACLIIFIFFTLSIMYSYYYNPSLYIAKNQGTVLTENWWQALNWIKNNTAECAVIATYWDPGHFITGIAKRPVVFDGASQNALLVLDTNETKEGMEIEKYDKGIKHIVVYDNGKKETARIQDIATVLFTSDEDLAIKLLKNYRKPNCTEMYFIASSDLVQKAQWWTYFSTWDPVNKGTTYVYAIIPLTQTKPILEEKSIVYTYTFSQQQSFVIYSKNNTFTPYMQQGGQLYSVEKMVYFRSDGSRLMYTNPSAEIKGLLWLDPSKQAIIYMPPELTDALFTKMFFFNGAGLKNFELVHNWGGEVKLFKVKLD